MNYVWILAVTPLTNFKSQFYSNSKLFSWDNLFYRTCALDCSLLFVRTKSCKKIPVSRNSSSTKLEQKLSPSLPRRNYELHRSSANHSSKESHEPKKSLEIFLKRTLISKLWHNRQYLATLRYNWRLSSILAHQNT